MVFRINTGKSFPIIDNEDYLGITSLALSSLAEDFVKSTNSKADTKQILMVYITEASIHWQNNKEKLKKPLLTDVKASINKCIEWIQEKRNKNWKSIKRG